jgi:hypothetical protein
MVFPIKEIEFSGDGDGGFRFVYFDKRKGPYLFSVGEGLKKLFQFREEKMVSPKVFGEIFCKLILAKNQVLSNPQDFLDTLTELVGGEIIPEKEWIQLSLKIQMYD